MLMLMSSLLARLPLFTFAADGADGGGGTTSNETTDKGDPSAETKNADNAPTEEHMIPKGRLDSEIQRATAAEKKAADLEKQLKTRQSADEKRTEEEQLAKGEQETVITTQRAKITSLETERDSLTSHVEAYEAAIQAQVDHLLESVTDDKLKALVDGKTALEKLNQITKFQEAGVFTSQSQQAVTSPDIGATKPTGGRVVTPAMTRQEVLAGKKIKL